MSEVTRPFETSHLLDGFGTEARQTVAEKLTAESIVPRIDALYREAIARSGRVPRGA